MCGIAGVLDRGAPHEAAVQAMTAVLAHRGPDGSGIYATDEITLGHRRLSIVDVSEANAQPFASADGQHVLVYNGEIYNFAEIRRTLEGEGIRFRTRGDTEVILESYRRWGAACLERFRGMFAFALWDARRRVLCLARDRLGEKPLYYWQQPGTGVLIFASELPSLLAHPLVPRRLAATGLSHYLALNYTLGAYGMLDGVVRFPPGHFAEVRVGESLAPVPYWRLATAYRRKAEYATEGQAATALAELIDTAVAERLTSDVPLGAFLSGGLDSTTVVAAMARATADVRTFTVRFEERSFDEGDHARAAARSLGVAYSDTMVRGTAADLLPAIVRAAGEPIADTALVAFHQLSEFTRRGVKTCLSGDGSDEIFGGYVTFAADRLRHWIRWMPPAMLQAGARAAGLAPAGWGMMSRRYLVRQFLETAPLPAAAAHLRWRGIFAPAEARALLRDRSFVSPDEASVERIAATIVADVRDCHYLDQSMYLDAMTWLPDDVLVTTDRMSMAHGLELRSPFLDHRIVEFAAALPVAWKHRGFAGKRVLRASQRGRIPEGARTRRKSGLSVPLARWIAGPWHDVLRDAMASSPFTDVFRGAEIDRLWREHHSRQRDNGYRLFGLGCLAIWMQDVRPS